MRKCIIIAAVFLAVFFIFSATAVFAQYAYFGIKGGLSIGMWYGTEAEADFQWYPGSSKSLRIGGIGGVYSTIVLAKVFAIQPEVLFVMTGNGYDWESLPEYDYIMFKMNYIQVPVLLKFYVPMPGVVKLNIFAGPYAAYNVTDKYTYESYDLDYDPPEWTETGDVSDTFWNLQKFDYGVVAGIGTDFIVSGLQLNVDARYSLGLANIFDVDDWNIKNGVFAVMVGVGF